MVPLIQIIFFIPASLGSYPGGVNGRGVLAFVL
jgi:hypothetical protein